MKLKIHITALIIIALSGLLMSCQQQTKTDLPKTRSVVVTDPLPSWNEGASKKAIIDFVT